MEHSTTCGTDSMGNKKTKHSDKEKCCIICEHRYEEEVVATTKNRFVWWLDMCTQCTAKANKRFEQVWPSKMQEGQSYPQTAVDILKDMFDARHPPQATKHLSKEKCYLCSVPQNYVEEGGMLNTTNLFIWLDHLVAGLGSSNPILLCRECIAMANKRFAAVWPAKKQEGQSYAQIAMDVVNEMRLAWNTHG